LKDSRIIKTTNAAINASPKCFHPGKSKLKTNRKFAFKSIKNNNELAVMRIMMRDLFFSLITSIAFRELDNVEMIRNRFPNIIVEKVSARVSPAE
jgi:excinuclease UvrABC nuclease subunit